MIFLKPEKSDFLI